MSARSLHTFLLLAAASFVTPGPPPARSESSALDSMIATERAFSALSVEKGMKEAFLTFLDEEGMIFRPTATNGKNVWKDRPVSKATLIWEPEFAEMSAAGDLGYTTGPWEFRPPAERADAPVAHGHFITMWRKQPDGSYRAIADIGISHEKPARGGVGSGALRTGPAHGAPPAKPPRTSVSTLFGLDREFAARTRTVSIAQAFQANAASDVRLNLEGTEPRLGRMDALAALDTLAGHFAAFPTGGGVSSSGDLGYSYGTLRRFAGKAKAAADTSVYLNVWRHDAMRWELALSVMNPTR